MRGKFQELLTPLCQLVTYGLLIGAVLFLVYTGSRLYEKATLQKDQNEQLRSSVFYLQNQLAANDAVDSVLVEKGPEGDMLVLVLPEEDYRVYIYTYQGYLMEELGTESEGLRPDQGERISPVKTLAVEKKSAQRLLVQVDQLSAWINLRCEGGEPVHG